MGARFMTIFTIGYQGLDVDTFLLLLKQYDINTIVDIRELPISRKPGFSKKMLKDVLNLSKLNYVHFAALGCPRPIRDQYRKDGNWNYYTRDFKQYLSTQQSAISEVCELAQFSNCALLCYEADYNFCHRAFVANDISKLSGASIKHITLEAKSMAKTGKTVQYQTEFV